MCDAVDDEDVDRIKRLLGCGLDIDSQLDEKGHTPLHIAVISNRKASVKLLLEMGANQMVASKEGCLAIHYAAETCGVEVVEDLLRIQPVQQASAQARKGDPKSFPGYFAENNRRHKEVVQKILDKYYKRKCFSVSFLNISLLKH